MPPDDRTELKAIQEELKQLSQKQLEMEKAQPFFYRWLATNPDLKAIKTEIADLKERERRIYNILEVIQNI
jgi:uncharacterized membrane protein (DUF106 family)